MRARANGSVDRAASLQETSPNRHHRSKSLAFQPFLLPNRKLQSASFFLHWRWWEGAPSALHGSVLFLLCAARVSPEPVLVRRRLLVGWWSLIERTTLSSVPLQFWRLDGWVPSQQPEATLTCVYVCVQVLMALFSTAEIAISVYVNSLVMFSDGLHNASDGLALLVGLPPLSFHSRVHSRPLPQSASTRPTRGHHVCSLLLSHLLPLISPSHLDLLCFFSLCDPLSSYTSCPTFFLLPLVPLLLGPLRSSPLCSSRGGTCLFWERVLTKDCVGGPTGGVLGGEDEAVPRRLLVDVRVPPDGDPGRLCQRNLPALHCCVCGTSGNPALHPHWT